MTNTLRDNQPYGSSSANRYTCRAVIGEGSSGVVYDAWDSFLQKRVALKLYHAFVSDSQSGIRETLISHQLSHPNIVRIYDVVINDQVPCVAMELIDGPTLATMMSGGPLPTYAWMSFAHNICQALIYCHERHIVHCDLKPSNVLLDKGIAKVSDFGTAIQLSPGVREPHSVGTPEYMAPEQLKGSPIDCRTDIYALGALMFECATGSRAKSRSSPVSDLASIPKDISLIILKCLEEHPDKRYQNMHEVLIDLEAYRDKVVGRWYRWYTRPSFVATAVFLAILLVFAAKIAGLTRPVESPLVILPFRTDEPSRFTAEMLYQYLWDTLRPNPLTKLWMLPAGLNIPVNTAILPKNGTTIQVILNAKGANTVIDLEVTTGRDRRSLRLYDASVADRYALDNIAHRLSDAMDDQIIVGERIFTHHDMPWIDVSRINHDIRWTRRPVSMDQLQEDLTIMSRLIKNDPQYGFYYGIRGAVELRLAEMAPSPQTILQAMTDCDRAVVFDHSLDVVGPIVDLYARAHDETRAFQLLRERQATLLGYDRYQAVSARLLVAQGAYLEAISSLNNIVGRNPLNLAAINQLGVAYQNYGRFTEAISAFGLILKQDPTNIPALSNSAATRFKAGQYERAMVAFQALVLRQPTVSSLINLGLCRFYMGRSDDGLESFTKATELEPSSYVAWGSLGHAYRWMERTEDAKRAYQRALQLALKQEAQAPPTVVADIGLYFSMIGNNDAARHRFELAEERSLGSQEVRYKHALAMLMWGDCDQGEHILKELGFEGFTVAIANSNPDRLLISRCSKIQTILSKRLRVKHTEHSTYSGRVKPSKSR